MRRQMRCTAVESCLEPAPLHMTHIQSDTERTKRRIRRLQEYVRQHLVANGHFVCKHFPECRASSQNPDAFYEGQMSHVGQHYDLIVDGRKLRIVVVGQEYGSSHRCVDLERRTRMIDRSREGGFKGRNPHMRGTTSLLRLLLGRHAGRDWEGEGLRFAHAQPVGHIFDGFALVNFLLCTALKKPRTSDGSGKGCSSPKMRQNCAEHFQATLEILAPTVLVAQGQGVRSWMGRALRLGRKADARYDGPVAPENTRLAGRRVDVLTFNHPSARGQAGWRSPDSKYLKEVVEPTIRRWRDRI